MACLNESGQRGKKRNQFLALNDSLAALKTLSERCDNTLSLKFTRYSASNMRCPMQNMMISTEEEEEEEEEEEPKEEPSPADEFARLKFEFPFCKWTSS